MSDYGAPQQDHSDESIVEPQPADPAKPDHETSFEHVLMAVERMALILNHAVSAVPALAGMGVQLAALGAHVTAARAALTPPVEFPPRPVEGPQPDHS